jgi:hypothetical protein
MMKHDDDISSDSDDEGHDHDHEQKVIILISPLHLCMPYGMDNTQFFHNNNCHHGSLCWTFLKRDCLMRLRSVT